MTKTEHRNMLLKLFCIADYDYRICSTATVVNINDSKKTYDLLPMLDSKEGILKVIDDVKKGAYICPF